MAFQFTLATVLRVRRIREEREERLLQTILFEISQSRETLTRIDAEITRYDTALHADLFRPLIGREIHISSGEVKELKQNRSNLLLQIDQMEQLRDKQFIFYDNARRNREMLSDMRDEKRSLYESDLARREQKTLDDNYIARRANR